MGKETLQAYKYCMCTGCGCIGIEAKYKNEVADYRASIN